MDASEELFFSSEEDHETKDLELLLHSFSSVSLEEIASAYCRAGKDVEIAADILSGLRKEGLAQVDQSDGACSLEPTHLEALATDPDNSRVKSNVCSNFEGRQPFNYPRNEGLVDCMQKNMKEPKSSKYRKASVSVGTVSSVIGKAYARPGIFQRGTCEHGHKTTPTVKEMGKSDMTMNVLTSVSDQSKKSHRMKSIEEFLFSMFGDGFHLDKDMIRDILGNCDYDVQQAAKELLKLASTFVEDQIHHFKDGDMLACGKTEMVDCPFDEDVPTEIHAHSLKTCSEDSLKPKDSEPCVAIKKNNLEREVLESLFSMPERSEQLPKKTGKTKMVWKAKVVVESRPEASPVEPNLHPDEDKDNLYQEAKVSEFQALRKSAQQQWDATKSYYEAAAQAYSEGNLDRAKYLLEEGKSYNTKGRELDEESAKFFDSEGPLCSNEETQSDVTLDVHDHGKRQAIQLLKLHLSSLSGIPSIQFLKIIAETYPQTGSGGSRRQAIVKFLDKEHIKWHEEEGNPGTIIVRLVDIERDKLSFADNSH
ncbi:putative nuclear RNA export factor SDE5 isoform X2 [Nymphaea colorata]|uniref:putative nuclear RNA export factor SDE5 isoform X2 n=1 Tax=Nymphaea colorata TaxID=210225 RepID=UPI00214EB6A5|nr:putative nuclear RNA export factor SDE5 isoform X2 [Nymphaea colorata]